MRHVHRRIFVENSSTTSKDYPLFSFIYHNIVRMRLFCLHFNRNTVIWRSIPFNLHSLVGTWTNYRLEFNNWFVFQILKLDIARVEIIALKMGATVNIFLEFVLANMIINILIEIWLYINHSHQWVRILLRLSVDAALFHHSIVLINYGPVNLIPLIHG